MTLSPSETHRPQTTTGQPTAEGGEPLSYLLVPRTNAILCDSLAQILRSRKNHLCQTLSGDVHQIRWMMATAPRSICLLDNPNDALCSALVDVPNRPPIVLMVPADARAISLRAMMRLNPTAIVSYEATLSELFDALDAASRQEPFVGTSLQGTIKIDPARRRLAVASTSPLDKLTSRQLEVARWLADGYTIAEVAEIMELAEKTVESHRYRIMGRLNLGSRVELTRLLVQEGVVSRIYRPRADRETELPRPATGKASPQVASQASVATALR